MNHAYRRHVPALGFDSLTPFYDPLVAATTRERTFKQQLIDQAEVRDGHDRALSRSKARMNRFARALILACALAAAAFAARGDEQTIRRVLGTKLGDAKIVSVQKLPGVDLYEVAVMRDGGYAIFYTDALAQYFISGNAVDVRSGRNLTEERLRKLSAIEWNQLPFQWAITMTRGTGRRKIAILSDPNCPYCKRLEEDLARLDDITVHIFPYAIIAPQSVRQSKAVWCSKDRVKAWNDLMFRRIEPQATPDCDTPVEKLIEYGRRLGATATPTWFLGNGERYSGALPLEEVRRLLDQTSPSKP